VNLEEKLRSSYDTHLDGLDLPGGDVAAARRTGEAMRSRRRRTVMVAAAAVVAVAVGGSLVGSGRLAITPSGSAGHWRDLPAPPLSPRAYAESVWTGREVVVLGGETNPCPPNASCGSVAGDRRDGAAYDPTTDSWRAIPPAPVPVGPGDRLVVADGVVVLRDYRPHGSRWFTYEPDHNRWSRIDGVPADIGDLPSAFGRRVYATAGPRIAVYDVRRFSWSLLPPDTLSPRITHRRVTATPYGPVVTGRVEGSELVVADLWDGGAWQRLTTGQTGNNAWTWTGRRLLDLESWYLDTAGQAPPTRPEGGTLELPSGPWEALPAELDQPQSSDGWGVNALGGPRSAMFGLVYDDATGSVVTLPRPDGAPDLGTTAVWADGRLVVFGGESPALDDPHVTSRAWLWTP
jgi:hypothetical protein